MNKKRRVWSTTEQIAGCIFRIDCYQNQNGLLLFKVYFQRIGQEYIQIGPIGREFRTYGSALSYADEYAAKITSALRKGES